MSAEVTQSVPGPTLTGAAGSAVRGIPRGCQEAPGYILDVFDGSAWITQDGQITTEWAKRGIWPTVEHAEEMMRRVLSPNAAVSDGGTEETR